MDGRPGFENDNGLLETVGEWNWIGEAVGWLETGFGQTLADGRCRLDFITIALALGCLPAGESSMTTPASDS